jgi:hypothetical protein
MTEQSDDFHVSFDSDAIDFDPFDDSDVDDDDDLDDEAEFTPSIDEPTFETAAAMPSDDSVDSYAADQAPVAVDTPSASERTAALLDAIPSQRKVLLRTLALCEEPQSVASVNAAIKHMQQTSPSVYTPANLCALLEEAGALERITSEGNPLEGIEQEPDVVEVDGVSFYRPAEPVHDFWVTTQEGIEAVEADNPRRRLTNLFDDETYLPIYKRILNRCNVEGGASVSELGAIVNDDPLVQNPRLYAAYFIERLEKNDALEWQKTWVTTDIGREALQQLADVDDEAADEPTDPVEEE